MVKCYSYEAENLTLRRPSDCVDPVAPTISIVPEAVVKPASVDLLSRPQPSTSPARSPPSPQQHIDDGPSYAMNLAHSAQVARQHVFPKEEPMDESVAS